MNLFNYINKEMKSYSSDDQDKQYQITAFFKPPSAHSGSQRLSMLKDSMFRADEFEIDGIWDQNTTFASDKDKEKREFFNNAQFSLHVSSVFGYAAELVPSMNGIAYERTDSGNLKFNIFIKVPNTEYVDWIKDEFDHKMPSRTYDGPWDKVMPWVTKGFTHSLTFGINNLKPASHNYNFFYFDIIDLWFDGNYAQIIE